MAEVSSKKLKNAIREIVRKSEGEAVGVKSLRRQLEETFNLPMKSLDSRKEEIKRMLVEAMEGDIEEAESQQAQSVGNNNNQPQQKQQQHRHETQRDVEWVDEPEDCKGKDRSGQKGDFEGYLKKRGDQGRLKLWRKRYFRLYKQEGVMAYFKNDKDSEQLGEVSVTGAFLMEKRDDIAKLSFTITMKITARIWWLQAKDESERDSWFEACTPLMKEQAPMGVAGTKKKKPPLGSPLAYPPKYVQGWAEIEDCASTIQDKYDWTGLTESNVAQTPLEDGAVAITIHSGVSVVEEVREVTLNGEKEAFLEDLPKQLQDSTETVQWSAPDSTLVQARFFYDEKSQVDLLKKLIGTQIKVTTPGSASSVNADGESTAAGSLSFPPNAEFSGVVYYHQTDNRFALVDGKKVHFLNTSDAHSFELSEADPSQITAGTSDVFSKPRLWTRFAGNTEKSLGQLSYHLRDAFTVDVDYAITLNADESVADINGWYGVENKTSKTYNNTTLRVFPNPKPVEQKANDVPEKEKSLEEKAEDEAAGAAADEAKDSKLGGFAARFKKKEEVVVAKDPRIFNFPVVQKVTLPAYDSAQATFLSSQVNVQAQHLVSFESPDYQIKPQVAEDYGAEVAVNIDTVLRFRNPTSVSIPAGRAQINRRNKSGHGATHVAATSIPRVEGGEEIIVVLGKADGISATRKQTGFNFDADKHFIIETFEITIVNGRQQFAEIYVEESMHRWADWEITSSWPQHQSTQHPRKIRWKLKMNHGEDVTIKYTAFYSTFDLPSDYE